jgi:hypothetical protein
MICALSLISNSNLSIRFAIEINTSRSGSLNSLIIDLTSLISTYTCCFSFSIFGNYYPIYEFLVCTHYQIKNNDKDLPRYFKMHLDHGLEIIYEDIIDNPNLIGFDYLFDKIERGLSQIC